MENPSSDHQTPDTSSIPLPIDGELRHDDAVVTQVLEHQIPYVCFPSLLEFPNSIALACLDSLYNFRFWLKSHRAITFSFTELLIAHIVYLGLGEGNWLAFDIELYLGMLFCFLSFNSTTHLHNSWISVCVLCSLLDIRIDFVSLRIVQEQSGSHFVFPYAGWLLNFSNYFFFDVPSCWWFSFYLSAYVHVLKVSRHFSAKTDWPFFFSGAEPKTEVAEEEIKGTLEAIASTGKFW